MLDILQKVAVETSASRTGTTVPHERKVNRWF
jgi:hypothetical protein